MLPVNISGHTAYQNTFVSEFFKLCPLADCKNGYKCLDSCSDSKYGRTVYLPQKDNPRLFNIPQRDSAQWKAEHVKRTSVERSNKREKIDYKKNTTFL